MRINCLKVASGELNQSDKATTSDAQRALVYLREFICASAVNSQTRMKGESDMNNIIYIVGLVVVVLFVAGYLGLR